ncbi:Schwann cell myelin protein-like isoform X2 [Salarias fasciatus]|uniref:Schwann cell myelin protein-like isoform X2 n=1 Tax=Salarias fasciatus TaxID=181472 RepID=UPI001176FE6A|nr:Schwann cell myelin protein-like isoform X2 [Salarias fasciatus]
MPVLSFMWALCVNMMTVNMFLSLFFLSGAADACRYRSELDVKTPQKMEALSGSCLKIPCSFDNPKRFDGTRETSAMWIRDSPSRPRNIVYDSGRTKNKYPMNITGNLREKNCTTEFFNLTTDYTHSYYFRLINLPFKATAPCNPLEITVKDSPPRPTLQVSGDLNDLKEKESVTITCSAPTPCPHLPPRLTWSLQQDAHSQTEENTDGTLTTKIQQNITLSDQHDGFNLSCSAVYPVDGGKHVKTAVAELSLNVSYAPKNTSASISPSGLVSAGSWVNLSCSSRARPAVSYTWFKISDHGAVRVSEGDFYSFNVTEGGVYYCVAANHLGNQTSEQILLIVAASSCVGLEKRTQIQLCKWVRVRQVKSWLLKSLQKNLRKREKTSTMERLTSPSRNLNRSPSLRSEASRRTLCTQRSEALSRETAPHTLLTTPRISTLFTLK